MSYTSPVCCNHFSFFTPIFYNPLDSQHCNPSSYTPTHIEVFHCTNPGICYRDYQYLVTFITARMTLCSMLKYNKQKTERCCRHNVSLQNMNAVLRRGYLTESVKF